MNYLKYFISGLLLIVWCDKAVYGFADSTLKAGFRASRILQSYPNGQFPATNYWIKTAKSISSKFSQANPAGIWIVSLYMSGGNTQLNFPNTSGKTYPYIQFISSDQNESYLSAFDTTGLKVWLQVEPGAGSLDTLIDLVLNKYKHHPCVVGFGIDVEWYLTNLYSGGKKVTNEEAQKWEAKVKSINPAYTLFLKHYGQSWMPPNYRGDIIFIDDSQEFTGTNPLNSMVNEFKSWGNKFSPNKVGFQIGYPIDSTWWKKYSDPASTIGNQLLTNIPNCSGIYWVDFTITKVFPVTSVHNNSISKAKDFSIGQNYPNPFNSSTKINFSLREDSEINLELFNIQGNRVLQVNYGHFNSGEHSILLDIENRDIATGFYYYRINTLNKSLTGKLLFLK